MARPEKTATVEEITERFKNSDAALLTEYRGLSVSEIADLRNSLRDTGTDYKVLKNTLARLAVRELGLEDLVEHLQGPTAIAFVHGDPAAAAKAIDEAAKKYPVLVVKGGVLGDLIIDADRAKALAKLEPREVILTKIAMMLNQPAQQAINVLTALLRDTGSMLAQVLAQKEQDAPAETVAQTTDADETPDEAPATQDPAEEAAEEASAGTVEVEEDSPAAAEGAEEASAGEVETEEPSPVAEEAAEEETAGEADTTSE